MRVMPKAFEFRPASAADVAQCIEIRGMTRENAVSASRLNAMGITLESWRGQVKADSLPGVVCVFERRIVGYCFGDRLSGEIVVLALLPEFEDRGIGRTLLEQIVEVLIAQGHARLYLGCSPDPNSRSYGFYRHLGWRTTNRFDENQDEILELHVKARSVA